MTGHLYLASKRAAVTYHRGPDGALSAELAPGGTANVVADLVRRLDITWIASAMTDEDRSLAARHPDGVDIADSDGNPVRLHLFRHRRAVFDAMQYNFTSDTLWAAHHELWDRWRSPTFDGELPRVWAAFGEFGEDLGRALLRVSAHDPTPAYLVHDYQLMRVPAVVRAARPDRPVLLFMHIPWPDPDTWRVLPRYVRRPLVEDMLAADVVAFFTRRWVRNFLLSVDDLLPDAVVDPSAGTVTRAGWRTRVRALPLGYSPTTLHRRRLTLPGEVAAWVGADRLVVHAGRSDPIKNAARAVEAFRLAVAGRPELADARMVVRMNPHRAYVPAYQTYRRDVERAVATANAELGGPRVLVSAGNDVDVTFALFARADALLVNSIVDGQNLSAYEAALVNTRDAELILSENCGAAETLGAVSVVVNPFDLHEQADALAAALATPRAGRAGRAALRRRVAARYDLPSWVDAQVGALLGDVPAGSAQGRPA